MNIASFYIEKVNFKDIYNILVGAFLIALFAQIQIPLKPVPITLQTVAIMFLGYTLRPIQAVNATILYIVLGLIGLPIFSNLNSGPLVLFGPAGGYIFGFVPAVYILARSKEKLSENWLNMFVIGVIASLIIFLFGIAWLTYLTNLRKAIDFGFLPFIIPGLIKIIILVSLFKITKIT